MKPRTRSSSGDSLTFRAQQVEGHGAVPFERRKISENGHCYLNLASHQRQARPVGTDRAYPGGLLNLGDAQARHRFLLLDLIRMTVFQRLQLVDGHSRTYGWGLGLLIALEG